MFSSIFLSLLLLISSSHIRHSSSTPPPSSPFQPQSPLPWSLCQTILSNFCWSQTGSTTVATENSPCTSVRAAAFHNMTHPNKREHAGSKDRNSKRKKAQQRKWEPLCFFVFFRCCYQMPAHHRSHAKCTLQGYSHQLIPQLYFGALLTPLLIYIYDISCCSFTHQGGAVCISVSLNLKWISPWEENMNSSEVRLGQRYQKKGGHILSLWNNVQK